MHRHGGQQARPVSGLSACTRKRVMFHACEWTKPHSIHKEMNLWFIP